MVFAHVNAQFLRRIWILHYGFPVKNWCLYNITFYFASTYVSSFSFQTHSRIISLLALTIYWSVPILVSLFSPPRVLITSLAIPSVCKWNKILLCVVEEDMHLIACLSQDDSYIGVGTVKGIFNWVLNNKGGGRSCVKWKMWYIVYKSRSLCIRDYSLF